jgi:branched-chain amino acid transport system substrate-binding protein
VLDRVAVLRGSRHPCRRVAVSALIALTTASLAACGSSSPASTASSPASTAASSATRSSTGTFVPTATMAVFADTTGAFAQYGVPFTHGAQIAADYLKQKGQANLTLKVQDTMADSATAVEELRNDASAGVHFAVSYDITPVALAAGAVAQRSSILYLASAVAANVPEAGPFIYQGPDSTAELVANNIVPELQKLGAKTIAIAVDDDDFGTSTGNLIQQAAIAAGLKVKTYQKWSPTATDFSPQIASIKNAGVDAVASVSVAATGALFVKQARAAGLNVPMISGSGWDTPQFFQLAGNKISNVYAVTDFVPGETSALAVQFDQMYRAKYGLAPDTNAASGFDAVLIEATAMIHAGSTDPNKAREAMTTLSVDGVTGSNLHFSAGRSIQKQDLIVISKDGNWVLVG